MNLILASGSKVRSKILRDAGIRHRVVVSHADETDVASASPFETATGRALLKAQWVSSVNPGALVLGVDQVCYDPEKPSIQWGKPTNDAEHVQRLLTARGSRQALTTGFALIGPDVHELGHNTSLLTFRAAISRAEIEAYVRSGEGSGCAGGYAVEGQGGFLVEDIEGCFFNVLGLPIFDVWSVLRRLGWRHGESGDQQ